MIRITQKGDFSKLTRYLIRVNKAVSAIDLSKFGEAGVAALAAATPTESGKTANSWKYEIEKNRETITIHFCNTNINDGVPIAIIIQMGHGTGTGGWVEGRDYINPVIQPIFDKIASDAWREVTRL